jgi:hypothetical protein
MGLPELASDVRDLRKQGEAHGLRIDRVEQSVQRHERILEGVATSEELENVRESLDLKLDHFKETFDPIRKALYWVIGFMAAGIGTALLALILKR